jgi:hypothetical protein
MTATHCAQGVAPGTGRRELRWYLERRLRWPMNMGITRPVVLFLALQIPALRPLAKYLPFHRSFWEWPCWVHSFS